jgi:undecaprenyl-diphosphatase
MLDYVIHLDKKIFIFLNNLGSKPFDDIWLLITKQSNWIPFFLILLFILYKKLGTKKLGIAVLILAALITFTNEITDVIKFSIQRIRPCNDETLAGLIRVVKDSDTFSYFSGHASNSTAAMMFVFLILRKHYKYSYLIFLYPLIFAYSRIYLGLHFPLDIISGFVFGSLTGFSFYRFYSILILKLN